MSQNRINADEISTTRHVRAYMQYGGPRPGNVVRYSGQDAQYISIEGVGVPELGGVDPIWVHDPSVVGSYKLVGRTFTPPDLASATVILRERHGVIPRQLTRLGCTFNLYEVHGVCKDLGDFLSGWTDYVNIYSAAVVTDKDLGNRTSFDADEAIEDSLSVLLAAVYPIGALGFGTNAATLIDRKVVDVVYGSKVQCGSCGPEDDGTKRIYAVTDSSGAGSPGLPPELIYSLDGGGTWTETSITGIGATCTPVAIDIVGEKLVIVTSEAPGAIYWTTLNALTGAPQTWTKVTTGFVATKTVADMYVLSPREIFFVGAGGYIYKSTDITAGVTAVSEAGATSQDLARIHGEGETIVCVGAAGTVVKSTNRGLTWATTTTSPENATLSAVAVLSESVYWVGTTTTGNVYYTLTGGETWVEKSHDGSGSGTVYDIVFATEEVGYIAYATTGPAGRIYATWNGGEDWTYSTPRLLNLPVFDYPYRLAYPDVHESIAANNLAVAGLAGDGTDGILLLGIATRL